MFVTRTTSSLLVAAVLASISIFAIGAAVYPGGTHFDHRVVGHDFWLNTLCDVARSTALDGAPNHVGSTLARIAMTIFVVAVGATLAVLPGLAGANARTRGLVRVLACLATCGAVAVVHLPTDRYGELHAVAIVLAGVPAIVATSVGWIALLRERARHLVLALLGGSFLLVSAADFGVYVHEIATAGPPQVLLPILERLATILALAWMIAVARALWLAADCNSTTSTSVHST